MVIDVLVDHGVTPVLDALSVTSEALPEMMSTVFDDVEAREVRNALVFERPEPLVRYVVAILGLYGVDQTDAQRRDIIRSLADRAEGWFNTNEGPWVDPKGYLVATATAVGDGCPEAPETTDPNAP